MCLKVKLTIDSLPSHLAYNLTPSAPKRVGFYLGERRHKKHTYEEWLVSKQKNFLEELDNNADTGRTRALSYVRGYIYSMLNKIVCGYGA